MAAEAQAQATDNLALKKKARRRLVGTVALVLLCLLLLPKFLKNKSTGKQSKEPVVIMPQQPQLQAETVPETPSPETPDSVNESGFNTEAIAENLASEYELDKPVKLEENPVSIATEQKPNAAKEDVKNAAQVDEKHVKTAKAETTKAVNEPKASNAEVAGDKAATKQAITKKELAKNKAIAETKQSTSKPTKTVAKSSVNTPQQGYAVQLGVFANPENVKKMQAKIALAGFESKTASVPKGTRLRVGYFVSKQGAEQALETLKQNGLSGKIVAR